MLTKVCGLLTKFSHCIITHDYWTEMNCFQVDHMVCLQRLVVLTKVCGLLTKFSHCIITHDYWTEINCFQVDHIAYVANSRTRLLDTKYIDTNISNSSQSY